MTKKLIENGDWLDIFCYFVSEPKKEKTEQNGNGAVSPSSEIPTSQGTPTSTMPSALDQKPNRPSTLEDFRIGGQPRRLIMFGGEHVENPSIPSLRTISDMSRPQHLPEDLTDQSAPG